MYGVKYNFNVSTKMYWKIFSCGVRVIQAIDGDTTTICASQWAWGNWLSVGQVAGAAGTTALTVEVHNRRDSYAHFLATFEVWYTSAPGAPSAANGVKCGTQTYSAASEPAPYVVTCPYSGPGYVTITIPSWSYLTISEVKVLG